LVETYETKSSLSDISEESFQINELAISSFDLDTSNHNTSKQINVLNQDEEFILEAVKRLNNL
jgi:hypothetical protein